LADFQSSLKAQLRSDDPLLQDLGHYILDIAGKHLRPAVTLLSARMSGESTDLPIRMAIAIELLHTATLIHDDIVDGSEFRRNRESLNRKWGTEIALIGGDYIYAKAFSSLSEIADPRVNQMFSLCALRICEGEMKQVETRKTPFVSEEHYLSMIYKKTAVLFETACAAGGYAAGLPLPQIQHLAEYGKCFGMTYQIVDDCLDLVGTAEVLGKENGSDFEKSDPTLPLIYLMEELNGAFPAHDFAKVRVLAVQKGAVERSLKVARKYAAQAVAALEHSPAGPFRKSLLDLVDFTLQRI
jgi:octaprenyl-diphosphate synthase